MLGPDLYLSAYTDSLQLPSLASNVILPAMASCVCFRLADFDSGIGFGGKADCVPPWP